MNHYKGVIACLLVPFMMTSAGCSMLGYQLGRSLPAYIKSVHVPVFENATGEPGLGAEMTRATIQEFHREGSLSVTDEERADIWLQVRLTDFQTRAVRYGADTATVGEEYRFRVRAEVRLVRASTGMEMFSKTMVGEADGELGGDIVSAKAQVLPEVAQDLAYRIVTAVVEYW